MKSLRARLIAGSALVALVPLAVAMYLLSQRVESMVRTQAAERLNAALGGLQTELDLDRARIDEQLQILAKDATLKRLYLLQPSGSRDLNDYVAERQSLLGLDFLRISNEAGAVIGDGSASPSASPPLAMSLDAPIRYEGKAVGAVSGGLFLDAAFLARLKQTGGMELAIHDGSGRLAAATIDSADAETLPARAGIERVRLGGRAYMSRSVMLKIGGPSPAIVTGLVSTASADQTIATLQWTSASLGLLGLGIAILLGTLWSSQISRPVERLANYSHKLAQGEWDEPLKFESVSELQTLVQALDRMRLDLTTYRDKLVTSERHAAWSQMARKVAHEVKNPLTPIAVSIADLKRSYESQRADFPEILDQAVRTISDEVETLKHLLQEFSDFARLPAPAFAPCRVSALLADLAALYNRDVTDGRLRFSPPAREITISADAGQIRQALINLIKNGLEAVDGSGEVVVTAAAQGDRAELSVSDTGPGLSAQQRAQPFQPGFTTKSHGSGLGLTIVERIVNEHRGAITVDSGAGTGTTFRMRLPLERRA
ncbi:MAG: HAMP domain-containing protein [Candidatus Eisenbacteria bacterium]|uniref:histidine kinase n=1 Tax=Eiseniibacteriota bacterium TaxID=2212470 RepID=A0A538TJE2_UNCEI|nr:MAG: HAMP domain-containing protein [Candidatus Eisenbacteria bacterium]